MQLPHPKCQNASLLTPPLQLACNVALAADAAACGAGARQKLGDAQVNFDDDDDADDEHHHHVHHHHHRYLRSIFSQARNRNHIDRSKCSACSISHCTIFRISSLALLFTSCMFVAITAAQHVNAAPLGTWANASSLSVGRGGLAATSLPNDGLAIFAGGQGA